MASNTKISTAARNALAAAFGALLNTGTLAIRVGSPPTNVSDASSGTLLGTLSFSATAFGSPSTGVITANSITSDTNADNSGDAGYFRGYPSGGSDTQADIQGTAGEAADTPDLEFDNKSVVAGGTIAVSSLTVTMPIQ